MRRTGNCWREVGSRNDGLKADDALRARAEGPRKVLGLTETDFAWRIGKYAQPTYSNFLNGRQPSKGIREGLERLFADHHNDLQANSPQPNCAIKKALRNLAEAAQGDEELIIQTLEMATAALNLFKRGME